MANNATTLKGAASIIREEDLEDMEQFQRDLEDKISQAHDDGRSYMMAQYVRLLATVKIEVKRIRNRFDRESLANHRRAQRELRAHTQDGRQPSARDASTPRNDA